MLAAAGLRFRAAGPGDGPAVAGLHADSWRRHYRGAFSDAFLDDVQPPGGEAARLNGKPTGLRYAWRDPSKLLA
jgi:hypothetical protein